MTLRSRFYIRLQLGISNREEEETIATGSVTENDLRNEHDLEERHGHRIGYIIQLLPKISQLTKPLHH